MPNRNNDLNSIAKHVCILNKELGLVKIDVEKINNDVKWIKKIMGYMATLMAGIFISVLGAVVKYLFLS